MDTKVSGICTPLARHRAAQDASRALRVLVAEDNVVNQKLAVMALGRLGHSGMLVHDGLQLLRCLAGRSFDVVLLDDHMPQMDGLQALASMRARELLGARRHRVIMCTANDLPGDRQRYLQRGADGYVPKPIRVDILRDELERVLALPG